MTAPSLAIGCGLLAFSPALSLLFIFTSPKAPLIILVTIAAFAQLVSCLIASILHLPFTLLKSIEGSAFIIIPTSVFAQALCRCGLVFVYDKVEKVVQLSIQHDIDEDDQRAVNTSTTEQLQGQHETTTSSTNDSNNSAKLRLHLNDVSSAITAGVGFGGMKTVMLYGTLLASELGRLGTLYQHSCSFMPSLVNSAILAFLFGILDIVWMMLCFYGVKRCIQRNDQPTATSTQQWSFQRGALGGKAALLAMLVSHLVASIATTPNTIMESNGCLVSLPLVAATLIGAIIFFWIYCKDVYLSNGQRIQFDQNNSMHLD